VVNANYTGGSISVFPVKEDGGLSPFTQLLQFTGSSVNSTRQEKAHLHAAVFSPAYDYLFAPDLGSDKIRTFKFDATNASAPMTCDSNTLNTIPGSGPRHFTFSPNGNFAYCIEELSGMITAYSYMDGKLDSIQRIFSYSFPRDSYGSADIHLSPDGRFLYTSNRWPDENTIAIFSVDSLTGKLTLAGHQPTYGDHPRNFTLDPSGNFLLVANLSTNNIVVFKRDRSTGLLTKTPYEIILSSPSCLQMRRYNID
jgi:6-phosphogluconolactonase (cycloisomerase 2 family)